MVLLDVNVLVTAMREDAPRHRDVKAYVEGLRQAPQPFGLSDLVLSGTLRVLTHPRVFVQVPALLDGEIGAGEPSFLRWALKNLPAERIMFGSDRLGREPS